MATHSDKIDMIIDIIRNGGFEVYKKFKQVLKDIKHDTLLMKMKKKEDEIIKEMGMYSIFLRPILCDKGLDTTKPVFGVSDKMKFKPAYSATETS